MISGLSLGEYLGDRPMSDWMIKDLEYWDEKIGELAKKNNLDWFPINYEICDYYDMIGSMVYHGMPSHYGHWSYGKSFERTHLDYNFGMTGLPYELIINSNPSIAYLMKENPLYLQILIMAHCVGHSDFFKNNRIFSKTRPEDAVGRFRSAKKRVQKYYEDPGIGLDAVERTLDALRSIQFQTNRFNLPRVSEKDKKKDLIEKINNGSIEDQGLSVDEMLSRKPIEPDYDVLDVIMEFGDHLDDWKKDLIGIVREESLYFIPQIQTKVLNEGWASFWHYKLMHELDLPQKYHIPFLKSHNQVIRPHIGAINPYHLGFHIFSKIEKTMGIEECFLIRETHDDVSAIRRLLDQDDCEELNLFTYSKKRKETSIDDVSDEDGWKVVKNDLISNTGTNGIPVILVDEILQNGTLVLTHDHDGRDLELGYAEEVINHVKYLWGKEVKLFTVIEEETWEI
jgi:stage V sporulation protein R